MKRNWVNILLLLAMAGISAGRCQSPNEPANLAIAAEHPTVKAGSDIWIKIEMKNTSKHPIDCTVASSNGIDLRFRFQVWGPNGNPLPKKPRKHPELAGGGSFMLCTLGPGRSTTPEENLLNSIFDMSQPGTYTVQLSRMIDTPSGRMHTKSNKLEIEVTP